MSFTFLHQAFSHSSWRCRAPSSQASVGKHLFWSGLIRHHIAVHSRGSILPSVQATDLFLQRQPPIKAHTTAVHMDGQAPCGMP